MHHKALGFLIRIEKSPFYSGCCEIGPFGWDSVRNENDPVRTGREDVFVNVLSKCIDAIFVNSPKFI